MSYPNCSSCRSLDKKRRNGWRNYFILKESFENYIIETITSVRQNVLDDGIKRLIRGYISTLHDNDKNCTICIDTFSDDLTITKCGHIFHTNCIDGWRNNTCPVCRLDISQRYKI